MTRKMGNFDVHQRTKDGMFNATALLEQWNRLNPKDKRFLDNFWKGTHLKELMTEIAKNELNFNSVDFTELKSVLTSTKRGRYNSGTWINPILFIKFAMYLSPKFEYTVIRFVYDNLIAFRHEAGDNYISLTASVSRFQNVSYPQLAKGLNWIIFDKHYKGIRDNASEQKLSELKELEEKLAFACDMGYIKSFEHLMDEMRKLYHQRNSKF